MRKRSAVALVGFCEAALGIGAWLGTQSAPGGLLTLADVRAAVLVPPRTPSGVTYA